jgi:peptide/nickel transport system ATP-binding protein
MQRPLLEIVELVTTFSTPNGPVDALHRISFSIGEGKTVGVVGESGSGKSVTSLSTMRLIPDPPGKITHGAINYHDRAGNTVDLATLDEGSMRHYRGNEIAMIFQEPMTSLNPVMTCGRQVMEALMLHKQLDRSSAYSQTLALFTKVELPVPDQMMERFPHQLSGGQKQRVMIAMAMACNPRLLIADEPTTALDVTVQKHILQLMKQLQTENGMGILFITHDLGVVAELADEVVVMYKGNIVESGQVMNVFKNPTHPYTKSLLACRPPADKRLQYLPTVNDFMNAASTGEQVNPPIITASERKTAHEKLYSGNKLMEVRDLSTWYPSKKTFLGKTREYFKAVNGVSFDVYEGETIGLVGESGCGKSTLGRTLLRLTKPTSGEILYKGRDILTLSEKEFLPYRKKMQLIFQDPYSSLNPGLTVGQAIAEPMLVHGIGGSKKEREEKVKYLLRRVGLLPEHFNRYPHQFSGGQRQRIVIARALAVEPEFIVCDESVSALDVSVQAQVLNLLNELKAEFKFTSIFISHDLGVVKYMSDRMLVMQKGIIEEQGDPDQIYKTPKSPYTARLIASIPTLEPVR